MAESFPGSYRARGLLGSRTITLGAEEVRVSQRSIFGTSFDIPFRLRDLDPSPAKMWMRDGFATGAIVIVAIVAASAFSVWSATSLHLGTPLFLAALTAILLAGLVGVLFFPFRTEITAFRLKSGNWAFDIRRKGSHAAYESFIREMETAIAAAQATAGE